MESFGDCKNAGGDGPNGEIEDASPGGAPGVATEMPPCFVAPQSLYSGTAFPRVRSGEDDLRRKPSPTDGSGSDPQLGQRRVPGHELRRERERRAALSDGASAARNL